MKVSKGLRWDEAFNHMSRSCWRPARLTIALGFHLKTESCQERAVHFSSRWDMCSCEETTPHVRGFLVHWTGRVNTAVKIWKPEKAEATSEFRGLEGVHNKSCTGHLVYELLKAQFGVGMD